MPKIDLTKVKRYTANAVTTSETTFLPGPVPVYLASDIEALAAGEGVMLRSRQRAKQS